MTTDVTTGLRPALFFGQDTTISTSADRPRREYGVYDHSRADWRIRPDPSWYHAPAPEARVERIFHHG